MSDLLDQSKALREQIPELLTRTSPDDIEEWCIEREEMRQALSKELDRMADSIREKKDALRALQGQIEVVMQGRRVIQSLKGDHAIDISKLQQKKWDLIRARKAYNIPA